MNTEYPEMRKEKRLENKNTISTAAESDIVLKRLKPASLYKLMTSGVIKIEEVEELVSSKTRMINIILEEAEAREEGFVSWDFHLPRDFELEYFILGIGNPNKKLDVVGILRLWFHGSRGYINMVRVDPKHRGQGLCTKLMEYLVNEVGDQMSLTLHVLADNIAAVRCYTKAGFKKNKPTRSMEKNDLLMKRKQSLT